MKRIILAFWLLSSTLLFGQSTVTVPVLRGGSLTTFNGSVIPTDYAFIETTPGRYGWYKFYSRDTTIAANDTILVKADKTRWRLLNNLSPSAAAWNAITGKPTLYTSPSQLVTALSSLSGSARLDTSAIKNLRGITTETDPNVPSHVKSITLTEKSNWNSAYRTGADAKTGLEALTGTNRLDASAVKNLPTAPNFKVSGASIAQRSAVNFIPGANVTITGSDNSGTGAVDITIAASGGSGGGGGSVSKYYYTPTDYGVDTTGATNALTGLKAMFDAAKLTGGTVIMPTGRYRVNGTLVIEGSGNENIRILIQGYGARFITSNADTTAMVVFNDHMNTTVAGLRFNGAVDYDGWYLGRTIDCQFKITRFGHRNTGGQDETYWSQWINCSWRDEVIIKTGTPASPHEFNNNTFTSCRLWSGAYAFKIYGTHTIQAFNLEWCDISYQTGGNKRIYIDQDMTYIGSINIIGGYFDDPKNIPFNTKNIVINTHFAPNNSDDGNLGSATLNTGSANTVSSSSGSRTAPRRPSSVYNLLSNGDIRYGITGITSDFDTTLIKSGAGYHGKYLYLATNSGSLRYAEWKMAKPAPFRGWYNITMIGSNVLNTQVLVGNVVQNVEVLYTNTQNTMGDTALVVTSGKVYLEEGQTYRLRVFSQVSVQNRVKIAYVGMTYGIEGILGAIEHPDASFPAVDNTTNLFKYGDGTTLSPNILTTYDAASIYSSSGEDQTGDGTVIRYNPLTARDFPEIRFYLASKYLKAAKAAGYVTFTLKAKVISGYAAASMGSGVTYTVPGITTAGTWQTWRVTAAVADTATSVFLRIHMAAAGTAKDIYFDGVQVNLGRTSVPWATSPNDVSGSSGSVSGLTTVANVAALRSLTGNPGQVVRTLGYYTANDKGGTFYIWNSSLSSSANPDNGISYIYPSSGSGGWELVYNGTLTSAEAGLVGDFITDDTQQFQRAIDFVVSRSGKLQLLRGIFRITSGLTIGTASPVSNPFTEVSFTIAGTGPTLNNTATDQIYTNGTLILLTGTGHSSIMNVRLGASRFAKFEDFTISCATLGGATNGFLWSQTGFSQHKLTRVHSWNASRAFAVVNGYGTNGEFTEFNFCQGYGTTRFYYMDGNSGQAFNQKFNGCHGSVDDGGILFELGGSGLGYGFTATEFETSNTWDNTTGSGVTLLKINGVSGNINFVGGRMEALSTLVNHTLGSYNAGGKINFYGTHFDGMSSKASRPFITSNNSGSAAAYVYNFQNCTFSATSSDATIDINLGTADASQYYFERCLFGGFKGKTISTNSDERTAVVFKNCREYDRTGAIVDFSKEIKYRDTDALSSRTTTGENAEQAVGIAENLLQYSDFGVNSGAALSPWAHYGTGTTFYEVRKIGYSGVNFVSPHSIQAILRATSGVSQVVAAAPFNTSSQTYYYQAYVSTEYALGRPITFSLENSSTGTVYESVTITNSNKNTVPILITLKATDGNVGGSLKLKIYNGGSDLGLININWQLVSKYANAVFVPTGSTAITGYTIWSQSSDMVRVTGRLKIPAKTDETGSAATTITDLSNDASADIYNSTTTGRLKNYSDGKWREIPNSIYASARPTTGTWKLGDIVYNTAPKDTAVFWVNTTAGTPGAWIPVGKYASGGGSGTVTSASVISANGFAGSVATSTTTPAITLSTTITGLLKGNGIAISAATAGTDYVIPSGSVATLTTPRAIYGNNFDGSAAITAAIGATYGGHGGTTLQAGMNNLAGAVTSGSYLRGNGTNVVMSTIQAGDLPTAIDAVKIGGGAVSNTEFSYVDGVTSAIQTQIDTKADKVLTANRQTASYTLVLGDAGKLVEQNVASANNLTVPPNSSVAFATGTQILLAQYGAGQVTVVAGSGVTIRSSGAKLKLTGQYSGATLVKIGTDEWYLFGDITN